MNIYVVFTLNHLTGDGYMEPREPNDLYYLVAAESHSQAKAQVYKRFTPWYRSEYEWTELRVAKVGRDAPIEAGVLDEHSGPPDVMEQVWGAADVAIDRARQRRRPTTR